MSAETGAVTAVRMPQVNPNDTEVTLAGWRVEDGGRAVEGEPLCEIETSKAVGDLPSPATGVVRHAAKIGDTIPVDGIVAYIGPSAEVIDSYMSLLQRHDSGTATAAASASVEASAGAIELARRAGIDLSQVPISEGRIRRGDVEKYIAEHPKTTEHQAAHPAKTFAVADDVLPAPLQTSVEEVEALSNHQWAISEHLKETQGRVVVAHALMDVNMQKAVDWVDRQKQAGLMASPLAVLIKAASVACSAVPGLRQFRMGRRVFRYREQDIAFTARSHQGWLYTPVVRQIDRLTLEELSGRCSELAMAAFRGQLAEKDLSGGCITVSLLGEQPVRMHVGLQNVYQSAILTSGAIRDELKMVNGQVATVPTVTLAMSYDHGLLDGWDAAVALDAARRAIENWTL